MERKSSNGFRQNYVTKRFILHLLLHSTIFVDPTVRQNVIWRVSFIKKIFKNKSSSYYVTSWTVVTYDFLLRKNRDKTKDT